MTAQAYVSPLVMEAHVQDDEGFAVIWRNAQRARGEVLDVWCSRLVSRLAATQQGGLVQARGATTCVCRASAIHARRLTAQDNLENDAM
jgi:hypothetical protein